MQVNSLENLNILITGSTDGLGSEVARRAAAAGANIILHGRDREKAQRLESSIRRENKNAQIHFFQSDLSSLVQVKELARRIRSRFSRLDILINNAAIGGGPLKPGPRELSRDGIELRFAVNYLSHFLLTGSLLPLLRAGKNSRIIHIASAGQAAIDFDDIMMANHYDSFTAYCRSKLAQIMHSIDLAEDLRDAGIISNSLHPATLMNTGMVHRYFGRSAATVSQGADVAAYIAFSPQTAGITGKYFNRMEQAIAHPQAYDAAARKRLRVLSEALTASFTE